MDYSDEEKMIDRPEEDEQFASLRLMAALSGIEGRVREVISDWILVTYDLPTTEEGNKARTKFLDTIRYAGGAMHSESCYTLPDSPESELAVIQLAEKTPSCYVWFSRIKDEAKAKELTREYDQSIEDGILTELSERIDKMRRNAEDGKSVNRMRKKTEKILGDAAKIAAQRGSEELAKKVSRLKSEYEAIADDFITEIKSLLQEL